MEQNLWNMGPGQIIEQPDPVVRFDVNIIWLALTDAGYKEPRRVHLRWSGVIAMEPEVWNDADGELKWVTRIFLIGAEDIVVWETPEEIFKLVQGEMDKLIQMYNPIHPKEQKN